MVSLLYKNMYLIIDFIHFSNDFYYEIKDFENIKFKSLFEHTPEDIHIEVSPVLIKIDWNNNQELLEKIQALEKNHTAFLWIKSNSTFSALYKVLKDKMYIKLEDKKNYLFRFYDVKCIKGSLQIFNQYPQHRQDLKIVKTWAYWDIRKQKHIHLSMNEV